MPLPDQNERVARSLPCLDLALFLVSTRLALAIVGMLSVWLLASGMTVQRGNLVYHAPALLPVEIWARWDSEWYLLIAEQGYDARRFFEESPLGYEREATAGFLPLYPLLIRLVGLVTPGSVYAGVLISNLCLLASLLLLFGLVRDEVGGEEGHRAGAAACVALLAFPMSLFLSAVYAESLFLMLSLAAFALARRGRFAAGGAAGALAAVSRPSGLILVVPLVAEWWQQRRGDGGDRPAAWEWLWSLLIPGAFGLFMLYCWLVFSDPLAFFARHERWRGAMGGPWRAILRWWEAGPSVHGAHGSTVELIMAMVFVAMLPFMYRRLRLGYSLYATAAVLLPLCSSLWSFGRFAQTIFPAFMLIGMAWGASRSRLALLYGLVSLPLAAFFMALYANWWWAG